MWFQVAGIAILLVFYGCYFIKMISQHKKGIKTDQIGKGKVGFVKFVEITMKVVTYLVPAVEIVSIILNISFFAVPVRIVGVLVAIVGVAVFIISVLTMRDSWRAGVSKTDKTELVTKGIYKISRNPAFLGFDLMYLGILLMFFNLVLFEVSLFAMLMFHLQIVNVEEEFLLEAFGDEYLRYKKKVCRYIGRKR
ncbi:methyltransferase family protein [Oscillospiraceae bacterium LCP25S3_E10]|nr:isoprenylcysteine carboxylmethyltransferase family protein [Ruminococcus sp.]MDD6446677.1 isoprenylcysteine carboxylmethyltransferase family protein [Ruminococcus sp.]MDY2855525.1 isoprenylcysteine carboxylmethyltransferase family protein [Oscillospiraceae bacterium]